MKKLAVIWILVVTAWFAVPQPTAGQEDGRGGFLDWIHRLSGPSMLGPGGSWYREWETVRFRLAGAYLFPLCSDKIDPDHSLNMLALRPSVEFPIRGPVEISTGLDLLRLGGDGHDAVYHLSIPLHAQVRVPVGSGDRWLLRMGLGARYFPSFDEEDFDGGVRLKTDGGEVTLAAILGFDYRAGGRDRVGSRRR